MLDCYWSDSTLSKLCALFHPLVNQMPWWSLVPWLLACFVSLQSTYHHISDILFCPGHVCFAFDFWNPYGAELILEQDSLTSLPQMVQRKAICKARIWSTFPASLILTNFSIFPFRCFSLYPPPQCCQPGICGAGLSSYIAKHHCQSHTLPSYHISARMHLPPPAHRPGGCVLETFSAGVASNQGERMRSESTLGNWD